MINWLLAGLLNVGVSSPSWKALESLDTSRNAAATVLVSKNNQVVLRKAFGFYDEQRTKHTDHLTLFNVASVSKQFTAAAIQLLVQQGRISLSDSILEYFSELDPVLAPVQISHLLHHTSGLPEYTDQLCTGTNYLTNADVVSFVKSNPQLSFIPGDRFEYNNTGYALLASLVERVAGVSFDQFLAQQIFAPLGIHHSRVITKSVYNSSNHRAVSRSHAPDFSLEDMDPCNFIYGDGTLGLTADDYPKWIRAFNTSTLFSKASISRIFAPGVLNDGTFTDYAHGWTVGEGEDGLVATHTGGWLGYRSYSLYVPKRGLIIFIAATSESIPIFDLSDDLIKLYW